MAISLTALPKFIKCTYAQYSAVETKDQNSLYFITDKNTFYVGTRQYSFDIVKSDADPTGTGLPGTIYYNTATGTASLWDGTAFVKLGVATLTSLAGEVTDETVPTSKAAKSYVDTRETAIVNKVSSEYVAKEEGKSLLADTEATKLAAYPEYSAVETKIGEKVAKITGTAGNLIKSGTTAGSIEDAGVAIAAAVEDSATALPTSAAVKTYADAREQAAKSYADGLISGLGSYLTFKGTKETVDALPATDNKTGDVWHVTATMGEYVWDGTAWQEMGSSLDLTPYVTKKTDAKGQIAAFDSNGDIIGSGKTVATSVQDNDTTIPTGKGVKTYADQAAATAADAKLAKIADLTAENNGELVTVSEAGASVAASGKKLVNAISASSTDNEVPTAKAAKAYADSVAQAASGASLPFVTDATDGHLPLIGANGEKLTDSGKSVVESITGSTNIPTDAAVKTYADGKISKVANPTEGHIVTVTAAGELADAGKTISATTTSFAEAPSATAIPNEASVAATLQAVIDAIAWKTL